MDTLILLLLGVALAGNITGFIFLFIASKDDEQGYATAGYGVNIDDKKAKIKKEQEQYKFQKQQEEMKRKQEEDELRFREQQGIERYRQEQEEIRLQEEREERERQKKEAEEKAYIEEQKRRMLEEEQQRQKQQEEEKEQFNFKRETADNLQGMIRSNSIIICEMLFTSDKEFFDKIGEEETKRYFNESYKFICNYKELGEKNIVSAVVHLDEGVPHMHLAYIPVVHTEDKEGNSIEKICAKEFWKGRDSYRNFQNEFYNYITERGFELKRGIPVEETGAKNLRIEELKQITNYEKTKQVLNEIQESTGIDVQEKNSNMPLKSYSIEANDLDIYEAENYYESGKSDPFAENSDPAQTILK